MTESSKYSLENIYEKLRKLDSSIREIERRLKIYETVSSKRDWDLQKFKKFMIIYLEEYKNEYVRDFVENDIDVARGEIERVLDILKYYTVHELVLWGKPSLELFSMELQFYEIMINNHPDSELKEFVKRYLENVKKRVEEIKSKIDSLERK